MGLIVDSFAGGGGASTGIEAALGRPIDIAINHDPSALAMHRANHPHARHYTEDIWEVDPVEACRGQPVDVAWFSPDCKHHSRAKGGEPKDKGIRGLAWVAVKWARLVRPSVIFLENVQEFEEWGPLGTDRKPIKALKGRIFELFIARFKELGYSVEWRSLRACDYGAPTTRTRFFMVARCDGHPIVWPQPTHGVGGVPLRTAAECIDWSVPCPSIFDRRKPLAEKTLARIAKGVVRYVLMRDPYIVESAVPFITEHANGSGQRNMPIDEPLRTICAEVKGGHFALVAPHITKFHTGSIGSAIDAPLPTVTAGGDCARPAGAAHAMGLVSAFLAKHYGGVTGSDCRAPVGTVTAVDHHSLVAAHLMRQFGTSTGSDMRDPIGTVMPEGCGKTGIVASFLSKYYGCGVGQGVDVPMDTVTAKDRFGLVTVLIDGETYVLTDIGMRMLKPRELFRAQGFLDSYVIDPVFNGRKLPGTAQVRMCGNSVCPPVAEALVRANAAELYGEAAA